jgi:asparagine synthase (glutamine-hydrolysing)
MCGIAGVVNLREGLSAPTLEQLSLMAGAMRHRGPDEFGAYRDARAGLAHARLSIIDLTTGQQPLSNEDGSLWIIFNGEIFNYVELRAELVTLGHTFRTQSDTEVIVHAWEAWGHDAFGKFNGQWAVALWDSKEQVLVLSRDRVGVRPLHLCERNGRLYFASEVKSIFAADPNLPRELDPVGIDETLTFWTVVPPQSVFKGITELPPGFTRVYRKGRMSERCYWRPRYPTPDQPGFSGTLLEAKEAVAHALSEATKLRMLRADVPVGSYLSGGLDSSLIATMGREAKGDRFCTFSLRFADAEYDETEFQRLMVKRLGSDHREVVVSRQDIARVFPDVIFHAERPILRTAPAPLFLLSGLVREAGIKVVLTGEGADEMFAGYDLFREAKVRRFWARQPKSTMRPRLLERLYPYLERSPVSQRAMTQQFFGRNLDQWRSPGFSHEPRWHTTSSLKRLLSPNCRSVGEGQAAATRFLATLPSDFGDWSFLAQDQYLEVRTLLSGYLLSSQGDRMLMGHSVEGRFPFLDANVMELANALPAAYKLAVLDEKHVLKRASEGRVPPAILDRKKQPYRAPDALCFFGPEAPSWVDDVTSEQAIKDAGVFDPKAVAQLFGKCRTRVDDGQFSNTDNMAVVGVLSTQLVHSRILRGALDSGPKVSFKTLQDRLA